MSDLDDLLSSLDEDQPPSTALVQTETATESSPQSLQLPIEPAAREAGSDPSVPEDPNASLDITKFVHRFRKDYDLISEKISVDRERMVTVLSALFSKVSHGVASDIETESLVKVLATLSDTNGHHVKLLDSASKLLSSARPALIINQNIGDKNDPDDLTSILAQDDDDELVIESTSSPYTEETGPAEEPVDGPQ